MTFEEQLAELQANSIPWYEAVASATGYKVIESFRYIETKDDSE